MSQKQVTHTPEPWQVDEPTQIWAPSIGQYVAITDVEPDLNLVPREAQEANARRIVLSVNACAGTSNEYLDGLACGLPIIGKSLEQLIKERDELLAALKKMLDIYHYAADEMTHGQRHESRLAIIAANAAISKAEQP